MRLLPVVLLLLAASATAQVRLRQRRGALGALRFPSPLASLLCALSGWQPAAGEQGSRDRGGPLGDGAAEEAGCRARGVLLWRPASGSLRGRSPLSQHALAPPPAAAASPQFVLPNLPGAGVPGGVATGGMDGPQEWPGLVGANKDVAKATVERDAPGKSVFLVPTGSIVTMDYRTDRVRCVQLGRRAGRAGG